MAAKFPIIDAKLFSGWSLNLPTNTDCTICRNNLNENSLYNIGGADSKIVEGICCHSFHFECIENWVAKNKRCPICSNVWCYKNK
jgi:hypothetical protein